MIPDYIAVLDLVDQSHELYLSTNITNANSLLKYDTRRVGIIATI